MSMSNNARKRLIFNNMEVAMVISQLFLSCRKCARKNSFRLIPQRKKSLTRGGNKLRLLNGRTSLLRLAYKLKQTFCAN